MFIGSTVRVGVCVLWGGGGGGEGVEYQAYIHWLQRDTSLALKVQTMKIH